MSADKTIYLLVVLLSAPFLASAQKVANTKLATKVNAIDLTNKVFLMGEEGDTSEAGKDLHLFFLFHKEGRATFRTQRGNTIIKDSPLSWRFTGDSLWLQPSPISLEADGKTQLIERDPIKYYLIKTPSGYLLKGKADQMHLIEQK
ncbi:hypothetical protein [Spirosoma sp.]|uniref:hypothetical protein n=1 Tax=Spirosoma sp. TaxID=1899569 RepID=UPI002610BEAB|nr:hypothetical protein [Spirosoma sp.]MCX6216915.1 hypothetical protein [Spirosoma sp.]